MHRLLANLNAEQAQAAATTEGYIRVSAGAGTGKTSALTARYAYIVSALGISARNCLCVTFTNKAADEMKTRIRKLCGDHVEPMVATFHGFCCELLRAEAEALGWSSKFSLWAVSDVREVLKTVYAELKVNGRELTLKDCWDYIDKKKCADLSYVDLMLSSDSSALYDLSQNSTSLKERIFYRYLYAQRTAAALDFDDLIAFTLYLLKNNAELRERWQTRLEYVMVDEFQDIDAQQYELVEILAGLNGNLFIVGDPDQTIYSFRGADVKFFTEFPILHKQAQCFYFVKNYRSSRDILDAAHTLISHNPDPGRKKLEAVRKDITMQDMVKIMIPHEEDEDENEAVKLLQAMDAHAKTDIVRDPMFRFEREEISSMKPAVVHIASQSAEASYIAEEVASLFEKHPHADIAVLYRASHVSTQLERAFIAKGIKYSIVSGTAFLERQEIRIVCAYMRLCLNLADDLALRYVINEPRRGFGKRRLERLMTDALDNDNDLFSELRQHLDDPLYTKKTSIRSFVQNVLELNASLASLKPTRALDRVLNDFLLEEHWKDAGDEQRLEGIAALRQLAYDFEEQEGESTNVADFLSHIALSSQIDSNQEKNTVKFMTVHASKGLEFDYVFLAGLNDGIFPSAKSSTPGEIQEERRLMYVAMTRAKKQLFITEGRAFVQGGRPNEPSRFLSDLNADQVVEIGKIADRSRYAMAQNEQASFCLNDRVFHEIFGPGTVLEVDSAHREYKIIFDVQKRTRTLSFSAPLEAFKD